MPSEKPVVEIPDGPPPTELQIEDLTVGDGPEATSGTTCTMQYVGNSWSTGKQFDASWDRGEPFSFQLGAGMVIRGWDEGVAGMKVGGRRLVTIPSDLAYGPQGQGPIPGGATLTFVLDLVEVSA